MTKRIRQYIGIAVAIAAYYLIHEGAHLVTAVCSGVFRQIHFMGLGLQIDVYAERMTQFQLGIFCLTGPAAAPTAGFVLTAMAKTICRTSSKVLKAVMWYVTLALMLLDPLYLSMLYSFFGGGDMNGISLLLPETAARMVFAGIGILNGLLIWKYLLPEYRKAFGE